MVLQKYLGQVLWCVNTSSHYLRTPPETRQLRSPHSPVICLKVETGCLNVIVAVPTLTFGQPFSFPYWLDS